MKKGSFALQRQTRESLRDAQRIPLPMLTLSDLALLQTTGLALLHLAGCCGVGIDVLGSEPAWFGVAAFG